MDVGVGRVGEALQTPFRRGMPSICEFKFPTLLQQLLFCFPEIHISDSFPNRVLGKTLLLNYSFHIYEMDQKQES